MEKSERFVRSYIQGGLGEALEIWVDWETGVNYLFRRNGSASGFTPLLGLGGKPVVTPAGEMGGTSHGL